MYIIHSQIIAVIGLAAGWQTGDQQHYPLAFNKSKQESKTYDLFLVMKYLLVTTPRSGELSIAAVLLFIRFNKLSRNLIVKAVNV